MRSTLMHLVSLAVGGALCVAAAVQAADLIERRSGQAVAQALADDAHGWARVTADGLQVRLMGTAPDEATRFKALTVAGSVVEPARVVDVTEVRPADALPAPDFVIEMLRNGDDISLIGLIPAETDRERLRAGIGAIAGDPQDVTDLLEVAEHPAPQGWDDALDFAAEALAALPRAKISANAAHVSITAVVDDLEDRRALEADLTATAPESVALSLDITAPRPVISPFTLRLTLEGGAAHFDACAADTAQARTRILAAVAEGGLDGPAECPLGLGAPSPRWGEAASAAIGALDRIGGGSLTLSDTDVTLVADQEVDGDVFAREAAALGAALPEGFSLQADVPEAPAEDAPATPLTPPEFVATRTEDGGVEMRGPLDSVRVRDMVESFAQARFGSAGIRLASRIDPVVPDGWALRVLASLDALGYLDEGEVRVESDSLSVSGETGDEDASDDIARLLAERLDEGTRYDIDVSYVEDRDPALAQPTAQECVDEIRSVAAARKITFDPGSSDLHPSADETLDAIAEILRKCGPLEMEIAGYTDSQGREEMNRALSAARAEAVLSALMSRRILVSGIQTEGYGEADPVADNDTEAGREANRRIEFRLLQDAPEEAAGEGDTSAEASQEAAAAPVGITDPAGPTPRSEEAP